MYKVTKSLLHQTLNFHPRQSWPAALPIFSWSQLQLTGFETDFPRAIVDLAPTSQSDLISTLLSCYQTLTLSESARLHICLERIEPTLLPQNWQESFWQQQQRKWNENLEKTVRALTDTPQPFQEWVSARSLGQNDLAILRTLSSSEVRQTEPLLNWIAASACTKNDGTFILETTVELWKMDRLDLTTPFPPAPLSEPSALRVYLERLRRPNSHASEELKRNRLQAIPWPAHVNQRWHRQGDLSSLELRFSVSSASDLRKKLDGLEHAYQHLVNSESNP